MNIEIRSFAPMPSRPCHYCLALQDDSVFADFNVDENGCLYLVRISYDGYGCNNLDTNVKVTKIKKENSARLIMQLEADEIESSAATEIIKEYFKENSELLWEDALKEHELI